MIFFMINKNGLHFKVVRIDLHHRQTDWTRSVYHHECNHSWRENFLLICTEDLTSIGDEHGANQLPSFEILCLRCKIYLAQVVKHLIAYLEMHPTSGPYKTTNFISSHKRAGSSILNVGRNHVSSVSSSEFPMVLNRNEKEQDNFSLPSYICLFPSSIAAVECNQVQDYPANDFDYDALSVIVLISQCNFGFK